MVLLLGGVNRNLLTILAQTLEADNTVGLGKQRVIAADANVGAGVDVGAALADQDVAGQNELTISALPFLWAKNCRPMFSIMQYHPFYEMIAGGTGGFHASITSMFSGYSS